MIEERMYYPDRVEVRGDFNGTETSSGPKIIGYAAVFNSLSEEMPARKDEPNGRKYREVIRPGAFADSLVSQRAVFALFQHDVMAVLGNSQNGTLRLSEDHRGLRYEIDPPDTQMGRDVVTLIRRGDVRMSSFGFNVRAGGQSLKREGGQIIRELRSLELLDVSPVTQAAYRATSVNIRSLDAALLDSLDDPWVSIDKMRLRLAEKS